MEYQNGREFALLLFLISTVKKNYIMIEKKEKK